MRELHRALALSATVPRLATMAYRRETSPGQFDRLILGKGSGVPERLVDVLRLKVGIAGQNFLSALAGREQPEQPSDRKPQSPDAWLAGADCGIDSDSSQGHALIIVSAGGISQRERERGKNESHRRVPLRA